MNIKVSIVIPTYKRSEYLLRSINSVLDQSYQNIEIVIVDDNELESKYRQKTEERMLEFANNNKVVYIKNSKNLGGALARNQGIKNSTGDYITFLDDDDVYLPNKIENQLKFMLENSLEMSFTDVIIQNSRGDVIDYREHSYIKNFSKQELLKQHILHHLTPTSTYMYRKDILNKIGGFDDVSMGQEFMLMLKTIENNNNIGYFPEANVIQYAHNGERISVGNNKLAAEKKLYHIKERYFGILQKSEREYVKFRHLTVMMIVSLRSSKYLQAFWLFIIVSLRFPKNSLFELIGHFNKLKKHKKNLF